MSSKTIKAYQALAPQAGGRRHNDVTGYPWPHLQPMRPTIPAPRREVDRDCALAQIAQYEAEASRLLARAADLKATLKAQEETES